MSAAEATWDVIVVGAGLSGLKAARELKDAGKRALILEARDRVGGRSMPGEIAGQTIDFGGQWVGPQQTRLLAEAQALGVRTIPQYAQGANILSYRGKVSTYTSAIPKLPFLSLLELGRLEQRLGHDMQTLPIDAPWLAKRAQDWDAQSVESWVVRNVRTEAARAFVRAVVGALLCSDTRQVSYLFFLDMLRRGQGLQVMLGVKGGAQQDKFEGGAWQIPKRMAGLLDGCIELNAPVYAIEQDGDGVRVITSKGAYAAKHVIMTAPPILAAQIDYTPPLPTKKTALLQRMPMGAVIKVHVAYPTPFWRLRGLNGSAASTTQALGVVFDQTPQDESMGLLVGLIEGRHAVSMSALDPEARRAQVIADIVHYFGDDAAQPTAYAEHDWSAEAWSRGGYAAHMPPGIMSFYGDALRQPVGRIHWAGTETATEWMGYLEGALQSGSRAAAAVLAAQSR